MAWGAAPLAAVSHGRVEAVNLPLMSVVPVQQIYVDANFKEGQLGKVRVGQQVELQSDLYGSDVKYKGQVVGFSGGSGSAFAAIPAQNATGNWIKIVQRVPVRITLDAKELAEHPLKIGLSMHAEVDMHDQSGPTLAQTKSDQPLFSTDVYAGQLDEAEQLIARVIDENAGAVAKAKLAATQNGKRG